MVTSPRAKGTVQVYLLSLARPLHHLRTRLGRRGALSCVAALQIQKA